MTATQSPTTGRSVFVIDPQQLAGQIAERRAAAAQVKAALPFRNDARGHPLRVADALELRGKEVIEAEGSECRQSLRIRPCCADYAPLARGGARVTSLRACPAPAVQRIKSPSFPATHAASGRHPGAADVKLAASLLAARRGVAQPGRALRSGRRGRRFKSCHPDHLEQRPGPRRSAWRRRTRGLLAPVEQPQNRRAPRTDKECPRGQRALQSPCSRRRSRHR